VLSDSRAGNPIFQARSMAANSARLMARAPVLGVEVTRILRGVVEEGWALAPPRGEEPPFSSKEASRSPPLLSNIDIIR
jgi:hypothetical protein